MLYLHNILGGSMVRRGKLRGELFPPYRIFSYQAGSDVRETPERFFRTRADRG